MHHLAYFIVHPVNMAGPVLWIINILIYVILALIVWMVLKTVAAELQVSPGIVKLIGLLLFLLLVLALFAGCTTADEKAIKAQIANTDVNGSVTYDGATVVVSRVGGKNAVSVGVDAKQIVKALNR